MRADSAEPTLQVEGVDVAVGNLERILYPQTETTKAQVLDYYVAVASAILPCLADRPLSLRRFPEGVDAEGFWQRRCPANHPDWLRTFEVRGAHGVVRHCMAQDLPSLLWLVARGSLELHAPLHRRGRKRPDFAIFDLDPGPGRDLLDCAGLGLRLREYLASHGLASFAKSSGKKGLHVMIPLGASAGYDEVKAFASRVAHRFEHESPNEVVAVMRKERRRGRIFIDWSQNDRHKTTVTAFSTRAASSPTVSTPLPWSVIESACNRRDPSRLVADIFQMPAVLRDSMNVMEQVLGMSQEAGLVKSIG